MRVMCVFGTRPEAIKMAPVVRALQATGSIDCLVCTTGQHREMLDQVLPIFDVRADFALDVMSRARDLSQLTAEMLTGLSDIFAAARPDRVLVHGDTTTTLAGSLAAHYRRIPVGHVEAGLRTHDLYAPWPEEANRQMVSRIADLHVAPTSRARNQLLAEGLPRAAIHVTGNTIIDALRWVEREVLEDPMVDARISARFASLDPGRRLILLTGHRRENHGDGLTRVFRAVRRLAESHDLDVLYPMHLNPVVQRTARRELEGVRGVHLVPPVDYLEIIWLLRRCFMVITDSGGIQEEAPTFGKPVLVTRCKTERPEAVEAGVARLVGTNELQILVEARRLLDDEVAYATMAHQDNPYGDGRAAERIAHIIAGERVDGEAVIELRARLEAGAVMPFMDRLHELPL